jgi:hypothetical protein
MNKLESLPKDVLFSILIEIPPNQLIKMCILNKNFWYQICQSSENQNPLFWHEYYQKWISKVRIPNNPKIQLFQIMKLPNLKIKDEKELNTFLAFKGYEQLLYRLPNLNLLLTLDMAIQAQHIDIIDEMKQRIQKIINNPPDNVIYKIYRYLKNFQGFSSITIPQVKKGVIQFLMNELENNTFGMDLCLILNEGWKKHALLDTDPRDQILCMIKEMM